MSIVHSLAPPVHSEIPGPNAGPRSTAPRRDRPGIDLSGHAAPIAKFEGGGYVPTDVESAWLLGFELARIGETSEASREYSEEEAAAFRQGWKEGVKARPPWFDEADDTDPDFESMFPDFDGHHDCERIEAIGAVAMRREGGRAW